MSESNPNSKQSILVVAAHPDDEILGPGATIAKHAENGHQVHVVIASQGATSRSNKEDGTDELVNHLKEVAQKAASILGAKEPIFLDFPDNTMDKIPLLEIVQKIEAVIDKVKPSIVYTHHGGDLNVDHELVHRAVLTASRPLPGSFVKNIYTFETVSSSEWFSSEQQKQFTPLRYVDVSKQMNKKLEALKAYELEMRPFPHARSYEAIEALANFRGANSGLGKAEAFGIIREVIN